MGTRRECRERLVTLYDATGSFSQVHGHAKPDLEGMSPVMCIYVDNSIYKRASSTMRTNLHTFTMSVCVKRTSTENSEDTLDDLRTVVQTVVDANVRDGEWKRLKLLDKSKAYFSEIEGVPYRVEDHSVEVKT